MGAGALDAVAASRADRGPGRPKAGPEDIPAAAREGEGLPGPRPFRFGKLRGRKDNDGSSSAGGEPAGKSR